MANVSIQLLLSYIIEVDQLGSGHFVSIVDSGTWDPSDILNLINTIL